MENRDIAKILYEISEYLAMEDVPFKPRAYEKAAISIEAFEEDVADIYKKGGIKALEQIEFVGKGIAEKIEELLKTGRIKEYEKLKKKTPVKLEELSVVEGVGPKTILKMYKELKIKTLKDLEKAAKAKRIRNIEGFGAKSEENILMAIEFLKKSGGRFLLGYILDDIRRIEKRIQGLKGVKKTMIAGSIRRMKETIGDADILATVSSPKAASQVMEYFINMPERAHIYSHGPTRSSVRLKNHMDFDLRVVPEESFGAASQYFTGNKDHNIELRKIAIKKGYKLNEYGLFRGKSQIAGESEEEIYEKLGLDWMPPEIRNNSGEIEATQKHKLSRLIELKDIKGDLQVHSNWTDGSNTIEEMARAVHKLGYQYIAITDHTHDLAMTGGSDEKRLMKQRAEIDRINAKFERQNSKFRILKGAEVNIRKDGSVDIKNEVLEKLDMVGAAVHSNFRLSKSEQTKRLIKAMENPNVDIIFHPSGRLLGQREGIELDWDKIFEAAKKTGTALEINAFPSRLDLNDDNIRHAKNAGIKLSIGTDAHSLAEFSYMNYGISQARRGWCEKKDVINTRSLAEILAFCKKPKSKRF